MKITIEPSQDQSGEKHPYSTVSINHPCDMTSSNTNVLVEMFYRALIAFGVNPESAQEALNNFEP